jgi:rRNA biogenesis protein RRP5
VCREEQEKLNVWVAYLNLEHLYGTEAQLSAVRDRAMQHCDQLKVLQQLAAIYVRSGKTQVRF